MQPLDVKVVEQVLSWLKSGKPVWFCTVLSTWGSSPREPGSLFAACNPAEWVGSLSGGCVEDDFLNQLGSAESLKPVAIQRYGDGESKGAIRLPCGGILTVCVEYIQPSETWISHFSEYLDAIRGRKLLSRKLDLQSGSVSLSPASVLQSPVDWQGGDTPVYVRIGPAKRLIIAGISPVAEYCVQFALALGFEVIVCEHRQEELARVSLSGCQIVTAFPADYILQPDAVHAQTAIVSLTHDPRVDDTTMLDAVNTSAFYIGVMGSKRTSRNRAERLKRIGQLDEFTLARIHMPIGLDIGSKTPAEIALAVMADIVAKYRAVH
ncbi:XdhC family protein [Aestuariibacter sp. GS-14]|uniref:XdhC family protein n=1 Tax=Aestuariibacter sp. GS-14 TaxID=2590670 RepID=UPI00112A0E44|nr:XdhC family protein [Aestuariibacter sp. GS-14]TPV60950.1 XdhC family protein [Aestuariibacter sp. GS-14]